MASRDELAVPARPRTPARVLMLVCIVLITHGSLYPWTFEAPRPSFAAAFAALMAQRRWGGDFGDVVGNIALFAPLGILWLAARADTARIRVTELLTLCIASLAFAWALQVLQLYTPARDPALADVLWNAVGLLLGLLLALALRPPLRALAAQAGPAQRPALVLVALWLALEWFPFVPTIDWQHVKDALKPLLLSPTWRTPSAIDAALGVLVVAQLLRPWRRRAVLLLALAALAALGKLFIIWQTLSLPHAVGLLVGLAAAPLLWRLASPRADTLGAVAVLAWFTLDALRPFALADAASTLHWVPFTALLQGSLSANVVAFGRAVFWLGAALVLAGAAGARTVGLAVGLSVWALLLEALQTVLPGRIADPTVALIPGFWVLLVGALAPPPREPPVEQAERSPTTPTPSAADRRRSGA